MESEPKKPRDEPMDVLAVYETMADRGGMDCDGCWSDDEGNPLNCLDVMADVEECCSACLGWWAICELRAASFEADKEET